jgi:hypothetical protein
MSSTSRYLRNSSIQPFARSKLGEEILIFWISFFSAIGEYFGDNMLLEVRSRQLIIIYQQSPPLPLLPSHIKQNYGAPFLPSPLLPSHIKDHHRTPASPIIHRRQTPKPLLPCCIPYFEFYQLSVFKSLGLSRKTCAHGRFSRTVEFVVGETGYLEVRKAPDINS